MTAAEFRELALSFPAVTESAHMAHPDFRAHGRIFATLGYPDSDWGMVKFSPPDQKHFIDLHPRCFVAAKGAWGLQGSTLVRLSEAKREVVAEAIDRAWQSLALQSAAKKTTRPKSRSRIAG